MLNPETTRKRTLALDTRFHERYMYASMRDAHICCQRRPAQSLSFQVNLQKAVPFIAIHAKQIMQHGYKIKPRQSLHVRDEKRKRVGGRVPSILDGAPLESSQWMATETRRCRILPRKCHCPQAYYFSRRVFDNPQHHTPSWSQDKAKENISVLPDAAYASFDGVVEMWMRNEKCFQDAIDGTPFMLLY